VVDAVYSGRAASSAHARTRPATSTGR
jgi:hypothetical protein